jgi:hypothetical protein
MRWPSWFARTRQRHRCVVGLDVSPDACHWVVLAGPSAHPDRVCCAERLNVPAGLLAQGEVLRPFELGQWLRVALQHGGHRPKGMALSLDDRWVSHHSVTLATGLSEADVGFQLQADVQSGLADDTPDMCIDYGIDNAPSPLGEQRYWVQAVPRRLVEVWQQVAASARLEALVLTPRSHAARRAQTDDARTPLRVANHLVSAPCSEALGVALLAWCEDEDGDGVGVGVNFLPHRQKQQQVARRAWLLGAAVCAAGGAMLALGLAMVALSVPDNTFAHRDEMATSARAYVAAQTSHALATAAQQHNAAQTRWLKNRQALQAQTLLWSRVLSQASQGVWVSGVQQQGTRWTVQGEALTPDHVQHLLQQLKALDIWAQAPELPHLQTQTAASTTGLPVFQFRMEAELKAGE